MFIVMEINFIHKGEILEIYTDGASRGNPGPSAWSFIFVKEGNIFHQGFDYAGEMTNNMIEYKAIIHALKEAQKHTRWEIKLHSDNQIAIKQINKDYRIKADHLGRLCEEVYSLCQKFDDVKFFHVSRENPYIKKCDELCNQCLIDKGFSH